MAAPRIQEAPVHDVHGLAPEAALVHRETAAGDHAILAQGPQHVLLPAGVGQAIAVDVEDIAPGGRSEGAHLGGVVRQADRVHAPRGGAGFEDSRQLGAARHIRDQQLGARGGGDDCAGAFEQAAEALVAAALQEIESLDDEAEFRTG